MKPKSALFISAALTAFVIAILAGVVSAFNVAKTSDVSAAASPTDVQATDTATQPATATAPTQVSPEQAASIASQFMKKTDVYSVEGFSLNGVNVYKVVFSSGDIVYVGLDGAVISTATPTPQPTTPSYNSPAPTPKKHRGGGGGGGGGGDDGGGDH
ncbi:MAG: hypothetical protein WA821_13395 [Anaerolineales bacterium]